MEKERTAELEPKKSALANVSAANKVTGLTLAPVVDGNIVHSSDIVQGEMQEAMMK